MNGSLTPLRDTSASHPYVLWIVNLSRSVFRPFLLAVALVAAPASGQPSAEALLDAWLDDWEAASSRLDAVAFEEAHTRVVDGPRGTLEIETTGTLRLSLEGRPRRSVASTTVNGVPFDLDDRSSLERRLRRALGPASMDLRRPAPLPVRLLESAEPIGPVELTRLGGTPVWRVSLLRPSRRGPPERLTAWFTTSRAEPHLLRLQRDRRLRFQDTLSRVTSYSRVEGLDLPMTHAVDAEIEQRRRLRTYTLVLRSEATYASPRIERR